MQARILIDPIPCPRPRITVRGRIGHAYYPASYKTWKEAAQTLIEAAFSVRGLAGPLILTTHFIVPRPKTTKLSHPAPDIDNYVKALMDAMTLAEVWVDDKQVVNLCATKAWGAEGSITITIQEAA